MGWNVDLDVAGKPYFKNVASVPVGPRSMYRFLPRRSSCEIVSRNRIGCHVTRQKRYLYQYQNCISITDCI
jgi:hypothetical protein